VAALFAVFFACGMVLLGLMLIYRRTIDFPLAYLSKQVAAIAKGSEIDLKKQKVPLEFWPLIKTAQELSIEVKKNIEKYKEMAKVSFDITRAETTEEAYSVLIDHLKQVKNNKDTISCLLLIRVVSEKMFGEVVFCYQEEQETDKCKFPENLSLCPAFIKGEFFSDNILTGETCPQLNRQENETKGSCYCLSLQVSGMIIGVLHLLSKGMNFFTPEVRERIKNMVNQIAPAVNNLQMLKEQRVLSVTDPLTGLYNRRFLEAFLQKQLALSQRRKLILSLIFFDLDRFKDFNDTYGHKEGDLALKTISETINKIIREEDVFVRYGGDEFIIILPYTDISQAIEVAERIRKIVSNTPLYVDHETNCFATLTLSIGVATYPNHAKDIESLINVADQALYKAKKMGGNKTMMVD
jgi:diguanylate cyclase (GGDEF)-like protein